MQRTIANRKVFPLGLGVMALDEYKPKPADNEAIDLLQYAAKKGVTLFDTADVYGLGRNETLLGKAFAEKQKQELFIATKGGCTRPGGVDWDTDGSPAHLRQAVQESLQRLKMRQIELYQLHAPDWRVSFVDSIKTLKEMQEQGLVKQLGLSNVSLEQLQQAEKYISVVSVQNHFNVSHKKDEQELLPYLTDNKIAFLPYFPLGSGQLLRQQNILALAKQEQCTASQLCLAWILQKWPTAIPIPGTRSREHLDENMGAATVKISEEAIEEMNGIFKN